MNAATQWVGHLGRDLFAAVGSAARRPGQTVLAVLVLGLGIGASTALFSVLDGVLLRGLPFPEGDRLVSVSTGEGYDWPMPVHDLRVLRERREPFDDLAGYVSLNSALSHAEHGSSGFTTCYVTGNLFRLLGVEPLLGRAILPEDEDSAAPPVVVLSHHLWRSRFAGDPRVIGDTVTLNRETATVVGVMPEGFHFPIRQEAWSAFRGSGHPWRADSLFAVARLPAGRSAADAVLALSATLPALDEALPRATPRQAWVKPYTEAVVPLQIQRALRVLLWAGVGLLLIACANTASLRLAAGLEREHERAVRRTLGASRLDLLRQQLAESSVIALAGAAVGLGIAWLATAVAARHLLQGSMLVRQFWIEVRLDTRSLAFAGLALGLALLVGGLLPALGARGAAAALRSRATARPAALRLQRAVITLELALAFSLLLGTGLLLQGARTLLAPNLGFDPAALSRTLVSIYQAGLDTPEERDAFWSRALDSLRARPEIEDAALVSRPPWAGYGASVRVRVAGAEEIAPDDLPAIPIDRVAPGTFELLRLPVRQGRSFRQLDAAAPPSVESSTAGGRRERPIVVSESFARRHLLAPAIGQSLDLLFAGSDAPLRANVVGVVADLGLDRPDAPRAEERLYLPENTYAGFLLVRARSASADVLRVIEEELARANPLVATLDHRSYDEERAEAVWVERRLAQLFSAFGALALLLGGIGLYGVLALLARRRERELGIRAAIGALPRDLFALVLREGGRTLALGLALGALLAIPVVRRLEELLEGIALHPLPAACAAMAVLLAISSLAALRPARRAAAADPVEALRRE